MCGIVGYVGKNKANPVLLDGLRRLEYRGYDSAGVALLNKGEILSAKEVGKVENLAKKLQAMKLLENGANLGIAHTRWATHGKPSEANAHPHTDEKEKIWLVHNGIIENYKQLQKKLIQDGVQFRSETDTEVIAQLIGKYYQRSNNIFEAVRTALFDLEGAYAIAVLCADNPEHLVVARHSSPLVVGVGQGEMIVASDASAILSTTKEVVYLQDGEIALIDKDSIHIETVDVRPTIVSRSPETLEWDLEQIEKAGHEHFMHKEIFEIPETVINASRGRLILEEGRAKLGGIEDIEDELREVERIVLIGCGTAAIAGHIGEYMLEEYAGIPTEVEIGSEFRYRKPVLDKKTLLIAISQSGETADTLAAVKEAQEKGIRTMGIINVVGSTIARQTGVGVYSHAGPEISVASTKAFASQLTVLALLSLFLGRQRDLSLVMGQRIVKELLGLPELLSQVLKTEANIAEIAQKYKDYEHMAFLGRKYNYPIALEGALKLKEVSYLHAEGYPAGEFKHGPIAMIDENFPLFVIAPKDSVYEKLKSNIEEVRARQAPIIALTTEGNRELEEMCDDVLYVPKTLEMFTPFLTSLVSYLFAYHVAKERGCNIDQPKNLAKSVTVE
ncbi:MAG: glutamine--fructose-6-phosphate transaminase (isomerizing) [Candidatus Harrisonbacteria bacterium]|nr:glutamine--fructose-6-phosphate transaminase (isomerizing) [Candidatus Harrisonbacteria bacterium]